VLGDISLWDYLVDFSGCFIGSTGFSDGPADKAERACHCHTNAQLVKLGVAFHLCLNLG